MTSGNAPSGLIVNPVEPFHTPLFLNRSENSLFVLRLIITIPARGKNARILVMLSVDTVNTAVSEITIACYSSTGNLTSVFGRSASSAKIPDREKRSC